MRYSSLALLPLVAASPVVQVGTIHKDAAPVLSSVHAEEVPNSYVVVFKKHVKHADAKEHHEWVQGVHTKSHSDRMELRKRSQLPLTTGIFEGLKHTYDIVGGFMGYSGHFDDETIEEIRRHPDVDYIEKDSLVHTMDDKGDYDTEKNAPWGLARISHCDSLSFGTWNKYLYTHDGGEGVDVYVIDTGTNVKHVDFEGRAFWGKTIPQNDHDDDGNGHGTHCSGTIAGKKYGVAKKANVYGVKVLRDNGSGTMSDVVKGVEFAVQSHKKSLEDAKAGKKKGWKGSAANMSLGGGKSTTLNLAVNAAVDAGIHFSVAAGNDNADSCNYSPAGAENAVTVGASTLLDERAYFSNYGKCNDIFAPGLNILSTWIGSDHATNTISGTSMASPHVAGLLAYLLSLQPAKDSAYAVADITPEKLKAHLLSIATEDVLTDVPSNTKNILAWNGGGSSNFTDIITKGGCVANKKAQKEGTVTIAIPSFAEMEEDIEAEFEKARLAAGRTGHHLQGKLEKLTEEIEDFVAEEMEGLFEELKERVARE